MSNKVTLDKDTKKRLDVSTPPVSKHVRVAHLGSRDALVIIRITVFLRHWLQNKLYSRRSLRK